MIEVVLFKQNEIGISTLVGRLRNNHIYPAFKRFSAMGEPIVPRPKNPTRSGSPSPGTVQNRTVRKPIRVEDLATRHAKKRRSFLFKRVRVTHRVNCMHHDFTVF